MYDSISIILELVDNATKALPKVYSGINASVEGFSSKINSSIGKMSSLSVNKHLSYVKAGVDGVGGMFYSMASTAVNAISAIAKEGLAFEHSITKIIAVSGSASKQFKNDTIASIAEVAGASKFGNQQIAESYLSLVRAGKLNDKMNKQQIKSTLKMVNDIAVANDMGIKKAGDMYSTIQSTWGLADEQMGVTMDKVTSLANNFNTNVSKITSAYKAGSGKFRMLGVDIDSVSSAIAVLQDQAEEGTATGRMIGSGLLTGFQHLSKMKPEQLKSLGVNMDMLKKSVDLDKGKVTDFTGFLNVLKLATETKGTAIKDIVGMSASAQYSKLVLSMDKYKKGLDVIKGSEGSLAKQVETMQGSAMYQYEAMGSIFEKFRLSLYKTGGFSEGLATIFKSINETISKLVDKLNSIPAKTFETMWSNVQTTVNKIMNSIKNINIQDVADTIKSIVEDIAYVGRGISFIIGLVKIIMASPILRTVTAIVLSIGAIAPYLSGIITLAQTIMSVTSLGMLGSMGIIGLIIAGIIGIVVLVKKFPNTMKTVAKDICVAIKKVFIFALQAWWTIFKMSPPGIMLNYLLKKKGINITAKLKTMQSDLKFDSVIESFKKDRATDKKTNKTPTVKNIRPSTNSGGRSRFQPAY